MHVANKDIDEKVLFLKAWIVFYDSPFPFPFPFPSILFIRFLEMVESIRIKRQIL